MAALTLRERRISTGIPAGEFAARIGVGAKHYRNIETGLRQPSPETLARIARGLGCDARELLVGEAAQR